MERNRTTGSVFKNVVLFSLLMQEHHLQICGFSREITLIDDGVTSDRSRFVTRIDLPVRKTKI